MVKLSFDDGDGVWRTVGGKHIFIRTGESLSSAMKRSGKFKFSNKKKGEKNWRDKLNSPTERDEILNRELDESTRTKAKDFWEKEDKKGEVDEVLYAKNLKEAKTGYDKLATEYKNTFDKMTEYNTERQHLSSKDSEEYKDLTNKYNTEREKLRKIDDRIETYKKENSKEYEEARDKYRADRAKEAKEETSGWDILEKQQELSKEKGKNVSMKEAKRTADYDKYVKEKLNDDEYLQANRPNEYFQKQMRENNVKTFADEIKENDVANRVKENKIVDSYGKNVVYQTKEGNYITSRQNYNDYVNGKTNKLGGELVLNEKEARERLASYDADEKYPYKGYVNDIKTGNGQKAEELKKETLNKMYKSIGYDDSKYNYGLEKTSNEKYTVDYFKQRGVEIKDSVPEGYVKLEGATTAPKGYEWYSNGKSRFGGEYKNALVKKEEKGTQSNDKFYTKKDGTKVYDPYKGTPYERKYDSLKDVVDDKDSKLNQYINEKIRRKAYQKYLKEHPASKITFEDFKDMRNINK